jgi:RND family efflux transporter MFP subunit
MSRTVILAALLAAGCQSGAKAELPTKDGPVVLGVRAVKPRTGEEVLSHVTGEIRARREATIAAEVSGRIQQLRADVGDQVKRGQVLFQLDPSAPTIQVEQAKAARAMGEANLQYAQNELKRTTELAKGEAAPASALERATTAVAQATAGLQQASAAVAAAEDYLRRTTVLAPFDGMVTARTKSLGEMLTPMPPAPVFTLVDLSSVEVRASVPETVIDLLKPGAELPCTLSPSGKPFRARVRVVGSVVDAGSRTVEVRADPIDPTMAELRPGTMVQVDVASAGAAAHGLFLPADAVRTEGDHSFVWVVEGEQVRHRAVTVEQVGPGTVRVVTGVAASDRVVAQADNGLVEGAKVRVTQ